MHWRTFLIANAAGAIARAGMWTFLGGWIETHFKIIPWIMHHLGLIAMIGVPLILALLCCWYLVSSQKRISGLSHQPPDKQRQHR